MLLLLLRGRRSIPVSLTPDMILNAGAVCFSARGNVATMVARGRAAIFSGQGSIKAFAGQGKPACFGVKIKEK